MTRVAVISQAVSDFRPSISQSAEEIVSEVSLDAFERAGISRDDLDALVLTDQDLVDGAAISSGIKVSPAGGYEKPAMRVQNNGGYGIHQAVAKIESGKADCVSVVAADTVEADAQGVSLVSQEPLFTRDIGQTATQSYGLLSQYQLETTDVTEADLAATAAQNYQGSSQLSTAHRREPHSAEEILESEPVIGPLRRLMIGPVSYGAAVLVLASEEFAANLDVDPVWITGYGAGTSLYHYRDMDEQLAQPSLERAAAEAYSDAGVDDPRTDLDLVEVTSPTPTYELQSYETLGLCEPGAAPELVRDGVTAPSGSLPVNLSGGAVATNALNTGGLYRAVVTVRALTGELDHAPDGASRALYADNDLHLGDQGRTDAALVFERGGAS